MIRHWQTATWAPSDVIDEATGLARPAARPELRGDELGRAPSDYADACGAWGWSGELPDGGTTVRRCHIRVALD